MSQRGFHIQFVTIGEKRRGWEPPVTWSLPDNLTKVEVPVLTSRNGEFITMKLFGNTLGVLLVGFFAFTVLMVAVLVRLMKILMMPRSPSHVDLCLALEHHINYEECLNLGITTALETAFPIGQIPALTVSGAIGQFRTVSEETEYGTWEAYALKNTIIGQYVAEPFWSFSYDEKGILFRISELD